MTGAGRSGRSPHSAVAGAVVEVVLPLAVYYGLRADGVGIYLALLGGALATAAGAALTLAATRRVTGMTGYVLTMMLLSTGVALLVGSPRFLLAREGWITGVTGLWFIASLAGHRPLAYLFSRPLLEGRFRWPPSWDELWDRSPRFRRMWRISSLLWGIGTLADSAVRVSMAYTLPIDLVPALGTALYAGTSAVIIVVTNIYYLAAGVYDRSSAMYRPAQAPTQS
jgi:hypothetical protein